MPRPAWPTRVIHGISEDLRYALRSLGATPAVTAVAVLSLALASGANTAVFSILNGLLLRPLPVHEPQSLVLVTDAQSAPRARAWSYPIWEQLRQRPQLFDGATAWSFTRFDLASGGESQFAEGIWADGSFFETLGVSAVRGRTFGALDDRRGGGPDGPVAVISHGYWQRYFGGADDVLGRSVTLNTVAFTIVGVTPPDFFGPEVGRSFDVIVPLQTEALIRGPDSGLDDAARNFLSIMARMKAGRFPGDAAAALRSVQPAIREATMGPWSKDVLDRYLTSALALVPGATGYSNLRASYEKPVWVIAAIAGFVLLIGCVNVANLLLIRATARRQELSLRHALGASRWRLARHLFAEALVLSAAGAALGVFLAAHGSGFLVRQLSTPANPVFLDVPIDNAVLGFTLAVMVMTALLFGTVPAFRAAGVQPMDALKDQGRATAGPGYGGLVGGLVVGQVALSMLLVFGAGLFIRSLVSLTGRELGIEPGPVLVVTVDPQRTGVAPEERRQLYARVREVAGSLPNVAEAAISHRTPVGGGGFTPAVEITAVPLSSGAPQVAPTNGDVFGNIISPGWFATFGTPLAAGRDFTDSDQGGAPRVAIVNQAFSRRFLGAGSPLGRVITVYPNTPRALRLEIVGVAGDAVYTSPHEPAPPTWYAPVAQFDVPGFDLPIMRLSVRVRAGSPMLMVKSLEAAISVVHPRLALTFRPLTDQIHASLRQQRLIAQLATFFGGFALLLAGLGLYGVTAYAMSRRQTEIGIRMALGATSAGVLRHMLARLFLLVAIGIGAGVGIGLWTSRFVGGLLYGISPRDPVTLMAAVVLLAAIGVVGGWIPARRAARIDPVAALRER